MNEDCCNCVDPNAQYAQQNINPILKDIENRFSYHPPKEGQPARYVRIRDVAKDFAFLLVELCPNSRERSTALTKLDEVVMFANASIARNE